MVASKGRPIIDMAGKTYGSLTVIEFAGQDAGRNALWRCKCECGQITVARGCRLRRGQKTCGCGPVGAPPVHGQSSPGKLTSEYQCWAAMKRRCLNPRSRNYRRYGGRGISICSEWIESFERFYADMGPKPSPSHSLDRIDNDGNYGPSNCRWATPVEQSNNRGCNKPLQFNGESHTAPEWSAILGISTSTITSRLSYGWSIERTLSTRPRQYSHK